MDAKGLERWMRIVIEKEKGKGIRKMDGKSN
jgi:hypothetical protein